MLRKPTRKTLKQTIADNRATLTFMSALAGAPAPVFHELSTDIVKPKKGLKTGKSNNNPTEAEILKSVIAFLRVHPKIAWVMRVNSGTFMEGDRYISCHSQKGMADVCGMMIAPVTSAGAFIDMPITRACMSVSWKLQSRPEWC